MTEDQSLAVLLLRVPAEYVSYAEYMHSVALCRGIGNEEAVEWSVAETAELADMDQKIRKGSR
jgi:hypothetical protein